MPATLDSGLCISVPTEQRGSSTSCTLAALGETSVTTPTRPFSVTTGIFLATPSLLPLFTTIMLVQVACSLPITWAAIKSNWEAVCL